MAVTRNRGFIALGRYAALRRVVLVECWQQRSGESGLPAGGNPLSLNNPNIFAKVVFVAVTQLGGIRSDPPIFDALQNVHVPLETFCGGARHLTGSGLVVFT